MTTPKDVDAIVKALQSWSPLIASGYEVPAASTPMLQAADALESLQAEVARLRSALEPFARKAGEFNESDSNEMFGLDEAEELTIGDFRRARTALDAKKD